MDSLPCNFQHDFPFTISIGLSTALIFTTPIPLALWRKQPLSIRVGTRAAKAHLSQSVLSAEKTHKTTNVLPKTRQ